MGWDDDVCVCECVWKSVVCMRLSKRKSQGEDDKSNLVKENERERERERRKEWNVGNFLWEIWKS